jgi:hypothetical protein
MDPSVGQPLPTAAGVFIPCRARQPLETSSPFPPQPGPGNYQGGERLADVIGGIENEV